MRAFNKTLHSAPTAMDEPTKSRIRELMFYVVPDPDEEITDDVLAHSESVDYNEGEKLKAEFRSIFETMDEYPGVCKTVLECLDNIKAAANEVRGDDTKFLNACDVMGRRIRKALDTILQWEIT